MRHSKHTHHLSAAQRRAAQEERKAMRRGKVTAVGGKDGPRYPNITVRLTGTDGNAMTIVGKVRRALDRAGIHDDIVETFVRQALSGDYSHVLSTCMQWVEVE